MRFTAGLARNWINLPIRTKGLTVVAMPVLTLLASLLAFTVVQQSESRYHALMDHVYEARAQAMQVGSLLMRAEGSVYGAALGDRAENLQTFASSQAALPAALTALADAMVDQGQHGGVSAFVRTHEASQTQQLEQLGIAADAAMQALGRIAAAVTGADGRADAGEVAAAHRATTRAYALIGDLIDEEQQFLAGQSAVVARMHGIVFTIIALSSLLGLLAGLAGMFLFTSGVVRRMHILGENVRRLARGQELDAPPAGEDEIGRFGAALHETAGLLAEGERKLREANGFLEHLIATGPVVMYRLCPDNLGVTYISANVERVFGYLPAELLANPSWLGEHLHAEDLIRLRQSLQTVMRNRLAQLEGEYRLTAHNGDTRWLHALARMEYGPDGDLRDILGFALDITDRRGAALALRQQTDAARLLRDVAAAANAAPDVATAMQTALELICTYMSWPVGHAVLLGEGAGSEPASASIWRLADPERFAAFRDRREAAPVAPGVGLLGRVLTSAQPIWVEDVNRPAPGCVPDSQDPPDVYCGFAFPVLTGDQVSAVLEFYAPAPVAVDPHVLELMAQVGTQLGRVVERQRAEQALRASEARFAKAFRSNPAAMSITTLGEGRFIDANDAFVSMVGHQRAELIGHTTTAVKIWRQTAERQELARRLRETGSVREMAVEFQTRSGNVGDALLSAEIIDIAGEACILTLAQDVTARKRQEADRARLTAILEATPDLVSTADVHGRLLYLNGAGRRMLGIGPAEDVRGIHISDVHARWADPIILEEAIPTAIRTGSWTGETALVHRDGREFPVSQVIIAHGSPAGEVQYLSTVIRDITEHRQAEAALMQAKDEAERANGAKSEFLSRMSHELRTPLNAILGFAQLLHGSPLAAEDAESVTQIVRAGRHLLQLINEVLDIARIESGRLSVSLEPINVADVFNQATGLIGPLARQHGVALTVDVGAADDPSVLADQQRLTEVVLNLLTNAVKYNRSGGQVRLSCRQAGGDYLRLVVADTGPGIAPENLERLFTPFDRLGAERTGVEGTGLGLSLSKVLTEAMGGTIGVESRPGEGSTFWVELRRAHPQTDPSGQRQAGTPPPGTATPDRPYRVLHVEDNAANQRLVERILARRPSVILQSVTLGARCLEEVRREKTDLILLDLHLPDMQGTELLRRLRAEPAAQDIPVVVISADARANGVKQLRAAGAQAYLTKPIDIDAFLSLVDDILGLGGP